MELVQGSDWLKGDPPPVEGASVLAAAEGGDRVLRLLASAPRRVAVIDRRPAQLHLVELKHAALQALGYGEYLEMTGLRPSRRRRALFHHVRGFLRREADEFWLARLPVLDRGVALQGTFERRLASFRQLVRLIQGRRRCERYLALSDEEARRRFLADEWNTFFWRTLGAAIWERWFRAPAARLERLLMEGRLLQPPPEIGGETFERARAAANRILVVGGPPDAYLRSLPSRSIDVFVLGRLDPEGLEDELARVAAPGARATLVTERDPRTCLRGFVAECEPREAGFFPGSLVAGSFPT